MPYLIIHQTYDGPLAVMQSFSTVGHLGGQPRKDHKREGSVRDADPVQRLDQALINA